MAVEVDNLLERVNRGDRAAFEELVSLLYGELRAVATALMRRQRPGHTLQPTALVNEAYLRLARSAKPWESRGHFFGAAARAMRQVLVGYARKRAAEKRAAGAQRVTFSDLQIAAPDPGRDVLALDDALEKLEELDPRLSRVLELRYFAGCSLEEIASLAGVSLATVKRDWSYAKAWLFEHMST